MSEPTTPKMLGGITGKGFLPGESGHMRTASRRQLRTLKVSKKAFAEICERLVSNALGKLKMTSIEQKSAFRILAYQCGEPTKIVEVETSDGPLAVTFILSKTEITNGKREEITGSP